MSGLWRKIAWREVGKASKAPYKARPNKNVVLTDEEAAQTKRRVTDARRAIEDAKIDKELGIG